MKKVLSVFAFVFAFLFTFSFSSVKAEAAEESKSVNLIEDTKATRATTGDYVLVTSASQLVVGKKVIIVAANYNYAMSATAYTYNRRETSVTKKTSNGTTVITPSSSVGQFTLTKGYNSSTYAFYDSYNGGYLCAASNSSNYLRLARSVDDYSSFTVSFSSGVANLTANYFSRNKLKYNYSSGVFACYSSGQKDVSLYQEYTGSTSTVSVTGVSLNQTSLSLEVGAAKTLTATVTPSNATNQNVTFSSSNTAVATVSSTGKVTAIKAGTATITATTADGGYKATCKVTVTGTSTQPEDPIDEPTTGKAAWTIMLYISGNDLESGKDQYGRQLGYATEDITEILSVKNQPNDVNIIIQTGGSSKWMPTYGISASYLQRYHVKNNKLVLDANLSDVSMGSASTFQSFLEWGLTNYPAEKTGVILWNHGGAMQGVCYDENHSQDSLLNSEVKSALTGAFNKTGRKNKLEFIGYDACLMSVQDVADFNAPFFNYMIASEESEAGAGWDYDTWVDDLYKKSSTTTIMKAIIDGFIAENNDQNKNRKQTLAYMDLAYATEYRQAFENLAKALASKLTSSNKSTFNKLVLTAKRFCDENLQYGIYGYQVYGLFDVLDFVNKLAANSTFNPGSTYTNAVKTALSKYVGYSLVQKSAGNANGLALFWSNSQYCNKSTYYTASETNFTNWRSLVSSFGA